MEWVIFTIFLFLAIFFCVTEMAFISANAVLLQLEKPDKKTKQIHKWLKNINKIFGLTLVGTNIAHIASSSVVSKALASDAKSEFQNAMYATLIITPIMIIIGEIIPKMLGTRYPEYIVKKTLPLVNFFYYMLVPIIWFTVKFSEISLKIFGYRKDKEKTSFISRSEIIGLVDQYYDASEEDNIKDMLYKLNNSFIHLTVGQIMTVRSDVIAIDKNDSMQELVDLFINYSYSRIPVYEDNLDNISGIVYIHDLLNCEFRNDEKIRNDIIRENVYFTPESTKCDDILAALKNKKLHMAVVVDEYGGIAGIVTIEDILEVLLGEIEDEYDKEEGVNQIKKDGEKYFVDARIELEKIMEFFEGIDIPLITEYDTLGGYLAYNFERIPKKGEYLLSGNYKITVKKINPKRIEEIYVERLTKEQLEFYQKKENE